ncbi:MAG TPA: hypothetical protein DCS28_02035 [Candidatus Moranbacteria bacterium]|nr:hypothetical protein [Candidatus Moranbacteria bacterium]HAT74797.1 hypothetical protein [Candidatus Moranbacteria bacterium]
MNQKISTGIGTIILIIIAITTGVFVWLYEKDRPIDSGQAVQNLPVNKKFKVAPICKNLCGDGNCDETVCMATGCPCPETEESCSQDCSDVNDISTVDWQTYKNEKYGFEFQYPKDWKLSENGGNNFDIPVIGIISPETQKLTKDERVQYFEDILVYYYPSVSDEPENIANNFKAATLDELVERNSMIEKVGTLKLGDTNAVDVIWGGEGEYYTILAIKNLHLYEILFSNASSKDELTSIEKTILSTFKFTK